MDLEPNEPRVLSRQDCLRRLSSVSTGRLGLSAGALPVVLPVVFAVDGESVVFPVPSHHQLAAAITGAVVAFEAGRVDPATSIMWTVTATGVATEIDHPDERRRAEHLAAWEAFGEPATRFARLSLDVLKGREGVAGAF